MFFFSEFYDFLFFPGVVF